jgi:hypothetical protein
MTNTILQQLEGIERLEAVKALIAALHTLTEGMKAKDLPGIVPIVQRLVPIKKRKHDPYAEVWAYLETIPEYTTGKELRAELVARFGEEGTPCLSHLYKYLRTRGKL